MKFYITRRGQPDFVCHARTAGDAIIRFWFATGETPKSSYRVHHGQRRRGRVVSAAVAFWLLDREMRASLRAVLEETATAAQFDDFCDHVIQSAQLLGK